MRKIPMSFIDHDHRSYHRYTNTLINLRHQVNYQCEPQINQVAQLKLSSIIYADGMIGHEMDLSEDIIINRR